MASTGSDEVEHSMANLSKTPEQSTLLSSDKDTARGGSLRAPVTIITALLSGLALALAHHFMNVGLNGKPVANARLSQAWVSRFSTALAFLVKTAFAISISAVFVQRQWLSFHRQSFKIVDIDGVTSILQNPLGFISRCIWFQTPILAWIALMSWALPFAAVVTPGSLSVAPVQTTTNLMLQVPQPIYNETNYSALVGGAVNFISTENTLYKLAYATTVSGQPVPLSSAYQNQTYHLQFNGPAVRCGMANDSIVEKLSTVFDQSFTGNSVPFASWVAGYEESYVESKGRYGEFETLDTTMSDTVRIFVMSNTGSWNLTVPRRGNDTSFNYTYNANVTECQLFNATYNVDFAFQYPQQTRNISISSWLNPIPSLYHVASPDSGTASPSQDTKEFKMYLSAVISYLAMMTAYGKLLVGIDSRSHYGREIPLYTSWNMMDIDWSRSDAVQTGLEELFRNYTINLLSDSRFIKNSTDADFIPVTVQTWPITYIYDRFDLLLAYGLSFLCTCLCAAVGLHAFMINHNSYENLFSTFLRTTNDPDLRALIGSGDDGACPLPKHLAQAQIMINDDTVYNHESR